MKNNINKTSLYKRIALILLGMFLTMLILEIGFRISGFTILSIQEHKNLQSIKQKGVCRIMCLGESTTQNQYPPYLEEILNKRNIGIKFSVIDKGLVATNTVAILAKLEANLDKYNPDIVVTMMGNNDKGIMYYRDIPESNKGLFQHCRVYRFGRLIYMHVINKLNKKSIYKANTPNFNREAKPKKKEAINEKVDFSVKESSDTTIEPNFNNDSAYVELGQFYQSQGKFTESEQAFKKALELNPNNNYAYEGVGWLYRNYGKFTESEQAFKKALELKPENDFVYARLGYLYQSQGKFTESEQAFKKALELNPKDNYVYEGLGLLYGNQGKFTESEQAFKKAIELEPKNDSACGGLAIIYCEMGNNELSEMYAEKVNSLRDKYYNSVTANNYHTLKQILDKRKIRLVSVQYPMHNIAPLKKIFKEEMEDSIVFVDNERIFKNAVRKEGYKEYFSDMFGGDFGHCTVKGNKLLAENIANAVLKEIFGK